MQNVLLHVKSDCRTGTVATAALPAYDAYVTDLSARIMARYHDPVLQANLETLDNPLRQAALSPLQLAALREMKRDHVFKTALPPALAAEGALIESKGRTLYARVRADRDWPAASIWLESVMDYQRRAGAALAQNLDLPTPLDGVQALWTPGFTVNDIDSYFTDLAQELRPVLEKAMKTQAARPEPPPLPSLTVAEQKALAIRLAEKLGMDMKRGGVYFSASTASLAGKWNDARINLPNPVDGGFIDLSKSTVHETGHALYTQGLPPGLARLPLGSDLGDVAQESQALLWEMVIGRTKAFCRFVAHCVGDICGKTIDPDALYAHRNRLTPTQDRKKADELTYHFHVIARWQAFRDLFEERITVAEYPSHLAGLYKKHLGYDIQDPEALALMDVHPFIGKGAVYPAYTLGHGVATQLWEVMRLRMPQIDSHIEIGDFHPLTDFLGKEIYSQGRMKDFGALIAGLTGQPLQASFQQKHLRVRFAP